VEKGGLTRGCKIAPMRRRKEKGEESGAISGASAALKIKPKEAACVRAAMESGARLWSETYLRVLAETGSDRKARKVCNVGPTEVRKFLAESEAFAVAVADSRAEYADRLEEEADRRAREGWDENVYQMGALVGTVRKYDGRLMEKLLEGARPEKYRPNAGGSSSTVVFIERPAETLEPERWREAYPATVRSALPEPGGKG